MSTIRVHLPDSLQAEQLAKKERVSINQLVTLALAEKISALMTEDCLDARSSKGDRAKFNQALARVPDVEPEDGDKL